jgi:hypothetical protein
LTRTKCQEYINLKCADCPLQYIGQTGRTFKVRFKEHIRDINNKSTSGYIQHILDTGHAYGKMNEIMDIVKVQEKGKKLEYFRKISYAQTLQTRNTT